MLVPQGEVFLHLGGSLFDLTICNLKESVLNFEKPGIRIACLNI